MCNMTVIGPVLFEICSGNEVKVQIPQKAQLDPLGVLCVKFEDNRTSTFRDMLRKRIVYGRPNAVTSSFSPLRPCVLNSD